MGPKGLGKGREGITARQTQSTKPKPNPAPNHRGQLSYVGPRFLLVHFGIFPIWKCDSPDVWIFTTKVFALCLVCVCSSPANPFNMRFRVLARCRLLHFFGIVFDMNEPWTLPVGGKYVHRWLFACLVFAIFWKYWKRFVVDFFLRRATKPMNINEYFLNLVHDADRSEKQCTNQCCGRPSEWSITNNWWRMTIALKFWDKTQWSWCVKTTQIDVWQGGKNEHALIRIGGKMCNEKNLGKSRQNPS